MTIYKINRRIAFIICFSLLLLGNAVRSAEVERDFVLFIYMNGSDLESKNQLATHNVNAMLRSMNPGGPDNFAIVLLMGGTRKWHLDQKMPQYIPNDRITYAKITRNGFQTIGTSANQSLGDPSTLTDFINYGLKEFPSKRYGLIFWNHGAGSVTGFGYDECYPNDLSLSLAEIQSGLRSSSAASRKLTFIGFDACLMATLETASAVAPYANYMIASQELEPGEGWDYSTIVRSFLKNPNLPCIAINRMIIDSFIESYFGKDKEQVTLSAVNLDKIGDLVTNIGRLFAQKQSELAKGPGTVHLKYYQMISESRKKVKSFGMPSFTYYGPDIVDLLDFCETVGNPQDASLVKEISQNFSYAVDYKKSSDNLRHQKICGLSIYFPFYNIKTARDLTEYYRCGFSRDYLGFVNTYAQELVYGNSRKENVFVFDKDSPETLSTDMIMNTRRILAVILSEREDRKWVSYGLDDYQITLNNQGQIVKLDDNNSLQREWYKTWISVGGKIVSAYSTFSNEDALTYTIPVYLNGELADLILKYDSESPSGRIDGARRINNSQVPDKGFVKIKLQDTLVFLHEVFDNNDQINYVPSDTIVAIKKKDIKVKVIPLPKGKYRYGYCLFDLYGRKHYTKFTDYKME